MRARKNARRRFLLSLGALAVAPAFSQSAYPFGLGVASGYPTAFIAEWSSAAHAMPARQTMKQKRAPPVQPILP